MVQDIYMEASCREGFKESVLETGKNAFLYSTGLGSDQDEWLDATNAVNSPWNTLAAIGKLGNRH